MENDCDVFKASVKDHHQADKVSIQLTGPGCWNGFFLTESLFKGFCQEYLFQEL